MRQAKHEKISRKIRNSQSTSAVSSRRLTPEQLANISYRAEESSRKTMQIVGPKIRKLIKDTLERSAASQR